VGDRFLKLACQGGRGGSQPCPPSVTPLIVNNMPEYQTTLMQASFRAG